MFSEGPKTTSVLLNYNLIGGLSQRVSNPPAQEDYMIMLVCMIQAFRGISSETMRGSCVVQSCQFGLHPIRVLPLLSNHIRPYLILALHPDPGSR